LKYGYLFQFAISTTLDSYPANRSEYKVQQGMTSMKMIAINPFHEHSVYKKQSVFSLAVLVSAYT
ncbi:MAG: hypothetical protein IJI46_09535, partial [Erysipelotrichaceae bacterium]|nr:hypothetical protein [Erysipelotrichaceae bacterium]